MPADLSQAKGTAKPCFLTTQIEALQTGQDPALTEKHVKAMATMLFAGGAETVCQRSCRRNQLHNFRQTSSTLGNFMAAMILYPDCQRKAQEQIDEVIGVGRLPEFDDRESLPYVECLMQEVLRYYDHLFECIVILILLRRWNPTVPLG
jgi:hypothetical protein